LCLGQVIPRSWRAPRFPAGYRPKRWERRSRCTPHSRMAQTLSTVRVVGVPLATYNLFPAGHASPAMSECDHSGNCDCATTRGSRHKGKAPVRPRRGSTAQAASPHNSREPPIAGPAGIVASAHGPGHRPVLPRPPPPEYEASLHPRRDPSATATSHVSRSRRHSHGQPYSPYEMAYDQAHGSDECDSRRTTTIIPDSGSAASLQDFQSWTSSLAASSASVFFPANDSLCGCGPTCPCPGCIEHRGPDVLLGAPCADPNTCIACLEYGLLGMPDSRPPDVPGTAYEAAQAQNVDEWLRQMAATDPPMQPQSAIPAQLSSSFSQPSVPSSRTPNVSRTSPQQVASPSEAAGPGSHEADMPYDPTLLRTYALWNDLRDARTHSRPVQGEWDEHDELGHAQQVTSEVVSHSGRCQCPAGTCACPVECCRGGRTTFALSAEREGCCLAGSTSSSSLPALRPDPGRAMSAGIQQPQPVSEAWTMQGTSGTAGGGSVVDWGALDVPRVTLSRASSHWSQSSAGRSPSSSSSLGSALVVPSPPSTSGSRRSSCSSNR